MSEFKIRKYAVVGAGNMGSGIAQKIASEGHRVTLLDVSPEQVEKGLAGIAATLEAGVERRIFRPGQPGEIIQRITGTTSYADVADADLVIEAVFEDLEVKKRVFSSLGEACRPGAILATNTSSFCVGELVESCPNPERILGLHYFYPPAMNRLVEVVGHKGTSNVALEAAWTAQEAIGKTPIRSADTPGFVVNRYFVPWLNEAVRMLEDGIADIPSIDAAARKFFGIGMGPFHLMNVTGVPIAFHAAKSLGESLHPFYSPAETLRKQVEEVGEPWTLEGDPDPATFENVFARLLGVVSHVATELVGEEVATVEDCDIGARVGLRWTKGPFQLINDVGLSAARDAAEISVGPHGLDLPPLLRDSAPKGIPIRLVSQTMRGNLASVKIERPDAMNALNPEVASQLVSAVADARATERPIAISGSGKTFIAGADIKFFVDHLRSNSFPEIQAFTQHGHELLDSLSGQEEAVVARVHGLSLGGGSELALACDWIAASPKASFGFPETGIGIYPGLGGTQRLPRRVGLPLAKWLIFTGQSVGASLALEMGLCDEVADFENLDSACASLAERGSLEHRIAPQSPNSEAFASLWEFFEQNSVEKILSGEADTMGGDKREKAAKKMRQKSANALFQAERLLNEGEALSLGKALALELRDLEEVFSHPDALEGLAALIEGRRPHFQEPATAP
ncbi:MAG TPA: 3-hydroxyacyl-CoA dehydrogenase [Planctomycetes bacterium]|nr:3-hydroxyacyl-CoA dehydrogenase [Planctomycetota bacterium]